MKVICYIFLYSGTPFPIITYFGMGRSSNFEFTIKCGYLFTCLFVYFLLLLLFFLMISKICLRPFVTVLNFSLTFRSFFCKLVGYYEEIKQTTKTTFSDDKIIALASFAMAPSVRRSRPSTPSVHSFRRMWASFMTTRLATKRKIGKYKTNRKI